MGVISRIRDRREEARTKRAAEEEGEGRRTLARIAADVYEPDDDEEALRAKIKQAISEDPQQKPFMAFLMKLLDVLLPFLIKLLSGVGLPS